MSDTPKPLTLTPGTTEWGTQYIEFIDANGDTFWLEFIHDPESDGEPFLQLDRCVLSQAMAVALLPYFKAFAETGEIGPTS